MAVTLQEMVDRKVDVSGVNVCPACGLREPYAFTVPVWAAENFKENSNGLCEKCKAEADKKALREYESKQFEKHLELSGIPPGFTVWRKEIGNNTLARMIRDNKDKSLYISGPNDVGKTRAALFNLYLEIKDGTPGRFWRFNDFAEAYLQVCRKDAEPAGQWLRRQMNTGIFVVDDICKRRVTQTAGELLYDMWDLVNFGEVSCRLWITANASLRDLAGRFENADVGDAVVSRIDRLADPAEGRVKIIQAG